MVSKLDEHRALLDPLLLAFVQELERRAGARCWVEYAPDDGSLSMTWDLPTKANAIVLDWERDELTYRWSANHPLWVEERDCADIPLGRIPPALAKVLTDLRKGDFPPEDCFQD